MSYNFPSSPERLEDDLDYYGGDGSETTQCISGGGGRRRLSSSGVSMACWSTNSPPTLPPSFRLNAPQRDDSTFSSSLPRRNSHSPPPPPDLDRMEEQQEEAEREAATTNNERNSFASTFSLEIPSQIPFGGIYVVPPTSQQPTNNNTSSTSTETAIVAVKGQHPGQFYLPSAGCQQPPPLPPRRSTHSRAAATTNPTATAVYMGNPPMADSTEFVLPPLATATAALSSMSKDIEYDECTVQTPIHPGQAFTPSTTATAVSNFVHTPPTPPALTQYRYHQHHLRHHHRISLTNIRKNNNYDGGEDDGQQTQWLHSYFSRQMESQFCCCSVVLLVLSLMVTVIVLSVELSNHLHHDGLSNLPPSTTATAPAVKVATLDTILTRGILLCGVIDQIGFSAVNQTTGQREGFEIDLCRAVGAAIFGNDGNVTFVEIDPMHRFNALQSQQVDVLAARVPFTLQSDIHEPSANAGFTFSAPYLYTGLGFAGEPLFVACAEALQTTGNCSDLVICVQDGTMHVDVVKSLFPEFVLSPNQQNLYLDFVDGQCNVIAGEQFDLSKVVVQQAGYTGNYSIGDSIFSNEPLSLVTRDDDVLWSDFVNWIVLGLLTAEVQHVTQSIATNIVNNPSAAVNLNDVMFIQAVAIVGNYAEMYQRHLESIVPRAPVNMLNNCTSPLVYPTPFGNLSVVGPGPIQNGTLEAILERGYLRCGITTAAFFSTFTASTQHWNGMDIDFCLAVSAALFQGVGNTIFIPVTAAARFQKLASGELDLLSRVTSITYERDIKEPTTGQGFSFAPPDFFSGIQFGGIPPYDKCADNVDVSSTKCQKLQICVTNGTTTIDRVRALFPERYIVPKASKQLVAQCLANGEGNAMAGDGFDTANGTIRDVYTGPYQPGDKLFSRENFAVVTRQDDPQWSSFVSLVVTATTYAEQQGITQATFDLMPSVNLFGPTFASMLQDVVEAVGSYADIFKRNAGSKYPRKAINKLNKNPPGPQHYPPPGLLNLF